MSVRPTQKFTKIRRCPICGGFEGAVRGKGLRCVGFLSVDGKYARCTREEHAGGAPLDEKSSPPAWIHKLTGECKCGETHGEDPSARTKWPDPVAEYVYTDASGAPLYRKLRFPKSHHVPFTWQHPEGERWVKGRGNATLVPYRLKELAEHEDLERPVYLVEGEKDVETLRALGYTATCNPDGAGSGKWRQVETVIRKYVRGLHVVILADADAAGRPHAMEARSVIHDVAASVALREIPNAVAPKHKDISDHLQSGGTMDQLVPLKEDAPKAKANGVHLPPPAEEMPADGFFEDGSSSPPGHREIEWPEPEPIESLKLPAFPVQALSPWLREWSKAEAAFAQVAVDLPSCISLACVSLAASFGFHVEIFPGYVEPTNLWIVVAQTPGTRKSAVYKDATVPIYEYTREMGAKLAGDISDRRLARRMLEGQLKGVENALIKGKRLAGGEDPMQRAREIQHELDSKPELLAPRFLTEDCTPEALGKLLGPNKERIGIFSSEGGPFEILAGRYSANKGPNIELFLKAHSGDPFMVDRVGRERIELKEPLVTMAMTVQPSVIRGLGGKEGFRDRGLIARFLYALPSSTVGHRTAESPSVRDDITTTYRLSLANLLHRGALTQRRLRLGPGAIASRNAYHDRIEPRMREDADLSHVQDWGSKFIGTVCRIAGVLHLADYALALAEMPDELPGETFDRATVIGDYFLEHALGVFALIGSNEASDLAKRLWGWIERQEGAEFTLKQAVDGIRNRTVDEVRQGMAFLQDRGLVYALPMEIKQGPGRPSSQAYSVNPISRKTFGTFGTIGT